jgi:hypothetical protein
MRNLLALLGAAVLTFVVVGWYLGWYSFAAAPGSSPGHESVTIDIDRKKIDADIHKGERKVEEALEHAAQHETAKQAKNVVSPPPKAAQ